jgi:hypothetical protein
MSDKETGSKTGKTRIPSEGWTPAADGGSVSKTYALAAPAAAAKLAKRALQLAGKVGQPVRVDLSGSEVTIGLSALAGAVNDDTRRLARRLDGDKPDGSSKADKTPRVRRTPDPEKVAKREARQARKARVEARVANAAKKPPRTDA